MNRVMIFLAASEIQDRTKAKDWIREAVLREILTFAMRCGMLVASYAVVRTSARNTKQVGELRAHGFIPMAFGQRRNAIAGNTLLVMQEALSRSADVIVFVGAQSSVPPQLIVALAGMGIRTIILTPEATIVAPSRGECVYRLRDLQRLANAEAFASREQAEPATILVSREPRAAIDRLVRIGRAEDRDFALHFLAATNHDIETFTDRLCGDAVDGVLSDVLWGILFMLGESTIELPDGTRIVDRQRVWDRFIRFNIDIDRVGQQFVIPLLCEEHLLFREDGTCDLMHIAPSSHPVIRIAQGFLGSVDEFWRSPPVGERFTDQLISAIEKLRSEPSRLRPPHVAALIAYLHALQRGATAGTKFMEADLRRLGVNLNQVRQIAKRLSKALGIADPPPDAPVSGNRLKQGPRAALTSAA